MSDGVILKLKRLTTFSLLKRMENKNILNVNEILCTRVMVLLNNIIIHWKRPLIIIVD